MTFHQNLAKARQRDAQQAGQRARLAQGARQNRAVRAERRRIQLGLLPLAITLQQPDGTPVEAVPVADLEQVISRGP
jgi:hypothetical protein